MNQTLKKSLPYGLTFIGILLFAFLTAKAGIGPIKTALAKVGFSGFFILVALQLLINLGLGLSWKGSVPEMSWRRLTIARFVRDAAGSCLPFSQLGGMIAGLKATIPTPPTVDGQNSSPKIGWAESIAANIVDITCETLAQIIFILLALLCLLGHQEAGQFIFPLIIGLVLLSAGIGGFIWTQQRSGNILKKIGLFLSRHIAAGWEESFHNHTDSFQTALEKLWDNPRHIACGAFLHLVLWLSSAVVTWTALYFLGVSVTIFDAIAIEGVVCGMMTVGFLVPGSLGVQEGAYMALGLVFGISTDISFSLSLLRRGRDIVIGVPVLLLWQLSEIRHLKKTL
ncbi:lysylphosphatidylglycerol synthase domain-containing protein [Acetobacteraceae bacterium ESL0709]|nr:lysylphosphatidylglycerol synthase domain-containing protein [Acetobacteraceae bacterium ESL0697]MDF7677858.1 lysylphosphatidylglycerol synthase domain-containing protein [Acetobacteraceae bacterium ESL0709]